MDSYKYFYSICESLHTFFHATAIINSRVSGCAVLNGTSEYILQFDEAWNDPNRNSDDFIQYKNFSCNETDCCTLGANCLNFIKDFTFSVENPLIVFTVV